VTEGPSLPPPRYSHTLHVEAPQPKPFAFLLGVALLAFAVPAGLVFAFLRFVSDAPPPPAEPAPEPPKVEEAPPRDEARASVVFELDAGSAVDAAPAAEATVASSAAPGSVEAVDGAVSSATTAVLPPAAPVAPAAPAAPVAAPASPVPVTWEMGGGILHSCRDAAGKYLDGFRQCGTASDLDHYLQRVISLDLQACDRDVPTAAVTVRANVDFVAGTGTIDAIDGKNQQVTGPWSACLATKFGLADLAKIRHTHPKYTLTYRVIARLGAEAAPR
jgi:hypothetical protein